jgi:PhnB protein
MAIKKLNPYLNFNGNGAEAVKLYESVLGAKVETLTRMGDMPDSQATPETRDRVMHALLRLGDNVLMLSDTMPGMTFVQGTNCYIVLDFDAVSDMEQKFNALAEGGKIEQPLQDTFWGARFGMLTDKLGVHWMFNCELKKS